MGDFTRQSVGAALSVAWGFGKWLLIAIVGLTLGFALASGAFYFASEWNNAVVVENVQAATTVSPFGKRRILDVHFGIAALPKCPSWTQHTIYKDTVTASGSERRTVVPLGITVNGLGSPGDKTQFDIPFDLPANVSSGAWFYTAITATTCEWLPGFQRQHVEETVPIAVWVPKEG